jgi:hypothetical protein
LRHHEANLESTFDQSIERGHRETRRTAKHEIEGVGHGSIASLSH